MSFKLGERTVLTGYLGGIYLTFVWTKSHQLEEPGHARGRTLYTKLVGLLYGPPTARH